MFNFFGNKKKNEIQKAFSNSLKEIKKLNKSWEQEEYNDYLIGISERINELNVLIEDANPYPSLYNNILYQISRLSFKKQQALDKIKQIHISNPNDLSQGLTFWLKEQNLQT